MGMTVLLAGGRGFIGSALADKLVAERIDWTVLCTGREVDSPERYRALLEPESIIVNLIRGDISTEILRASYVLEEVSQTLSVPLLLISSDAVLRDDSEYARIKREQERISSVHLARLCHVCGKKYPPWCFYDQFAHDAKKHGRIVLYGDIEREAAVVHVKIAARWLAQMISDMIENPIPFVRNIWEEIGLVYHPIIYWARSFGVPITVIEE